MEDAAIKVVQAQFGYVFRRFLYLELIRRQLKELNTFKKVCVATPQVCLRVQMFVRHPRNQTNSQPMNERYKRLVKTRSIETCADTKFISASDQQTRSADIRRFSGL